MDMVLVVIGVLGVMIAIDRQLHVRDMRLRALRVRAEQERRRNEGNSNA